MTLGKIDPISELPSFLSTISMVSDDKKEILNKLTQAERKSPGFYEPTRQLFIEILKGRLTYDQAFNQATCISDDVKRTCAMDILGAASDFLRDAKRSNVIFLKGMRVPAFGSLDIAITPVWLRALNPDRILILNFWRTPLSERQRAAAGTILKSALQMHYPQHVNCEVDFISTPSSGEQREFRTYTWETLGSLQPDRLSQFWYLLQQAWATYQSRGPRTYRKRDTPGLFDI